MEVNIEQRVAVFLFVLQRAGRFVILIPGKLKCKHYILKKIWLFISVTIRSLVT